MTQKLIFGTSQRISTDILENILKEKMIIHTSLDYSGYNDLKNFFTNKKNNKIIFKIKCTDLCSLQNLIEKYKKDFNQDTIYALQISRNPNFFDNTKIINYLFNLKKNKEVEKIYFELYWDYSNNIKKNIDSTLIDGFVFCYNPIEREVSRSIFMKILKSQKEIISLRSFSGFDLNKDNKTFNHISYLKYYLIKFYIYLLKKFTKKDFLNLCLFFLKYSNSNYSVFSTTNKSKLNMILIKYSLLKKKNYYLFFLKLINTFHNISWMFGGTNSSSSLIVKTSLYYKIEKKVVLSIVKLFNKNANR
jgi:hypothetical protein